MPAKCVTYSNYDAKAKNEHVTIWNVLKRREARVLRIGSGWTQRINGVWEIGGIGMTGELTQEQKEKAARLVARLLDPEDLGFAVTAEVRDLARDVLGIPRVETKGKGN